MQKFSAAGAPDPLASGSLGLRPKTSDTAPLSPPHFEILPTFKAMKVGKHSVNGVI